MTKAAEISILKTAIDKLGDNSYLGPALKQLLPWIEHEMQCDIQPAITDVLTAIKQDIAERLVQVKTLADEKCVLERTVKGLEQRTEHLESVLRGVREKVTYLNDYLK